MRPRLATAIALLSVALAPAAVRAEDAQLERLSWLAGCWAAEKGEAGSVEHWLPLAGGTMLGIGRTVRNGRTVEHEFMQIRLDAEGRPVFIAQPSRQKEATFVATSIGERAVTFENPAHDFPQRVIYRAVGDSGLAARIEGTRNGASRGIDFPMQRVACEGPRPAP
ncbi:hypothetical protein CS062_03700 [Roseateles chitinivorans]|uniref:DUF6265 domain-containing protein n=1 Tax=Roseateles chitinivorans TaxID=2917965 RepID=A0A2G9CG71_9BURK|nr:DUF6265 family protein [Roseateles chitinivorans]PIM54499.1 hypothetical protein CS062_03700 [Roseateles chitinivorans]